MSEAFPADVSVRIADGADRQAALNLLPVARQLLFRALRLQETQGSSNVRLLLPLPDGSLVQAVLAGALKQVYLQPALPPEPAVPQPEAPAEVETPQFFINDMWSGIARGVEPYTGDALFPRIIAIADPDNPTGPEVPALNQFHPDAVTVAAYQLDFEWQTPARLGVDDSGGGVADEKATSNYPKPCMYSGAMKRFVSAVLGVGRTQTTTAGYISGELPDSAPDLAVWNQYDYRWLRTHGIHFGDDGSAWLVEVSQDNGVCAMPVPLFDGTGSAAYLQYLASTGDTDTMAIVLEFGGVPTGEPFPTGSELADAIAAGTVVQLLDGEGIKPFYRDDRLDQDKSSYYPECGWAFSASGGNAVNTCNWYSRPDIVGPPPHPGGGIWDYNDYLDEVKYVDGYRFADPYDRFMRTELWTLEISISGIDPASGLVGSGTATLTLTENELVWHIHDYNAFMVGGLQLVFDYQYVLPPWFFPAGDNEQVGLNVPCFGRLTDDFDDDTAQRLAHQGVPVFAFYDGEDLEVVRYYPGTLGGAAPGYFRGTLVDWGIPPHADVHVGGGFDVGLVVPAFVREGYALIRFHGFGIGDFGNGVVETRAWLSGIGPLAEDELAVTSVTDTNPEFPYLGWETEWCGYHSGYPHEFTFAASINTGPLRGYVINDGVKARLDDQHYRQPGALEAFAIPDDTPTASITFVGSVADG